MNGAGEVEGVGVGDVTIYARSEGRTGMLALEVTPALVAKVRIAPTSLELTAGEARQLAVQLLDANDGELLGRTLTWQSSDSTLARVSGSGFVEALAEGSVWIRAMSGVAADSIRLDIRASLTAPRIDAVSPDHIVPGGMVIISGDRFAPTASANQVSIAGQLAEVLEASETSLRVRAATTYECAATRPVDVAVVTSGQRGSITHPLRVARSLSLQRGESASMLHDPRCEELASLEGRYMISVFNSAPTPAAAVAFQLRGEAGVAAVPSAAVMNRFSIATPPAMALAAPSSGGAPMALAPATNLAGGLGSLRPDRLVDEVHARVMRRNADEYLRMRAELPLNQRPVLQEAPTRWISDTPGALSNVRVPNLNATGSHCANYLDVTARTVYAGPRTLVLEDVEAPLAGTMDESYIAMGEEFETTMFDIIRSNFGDPLAMGPWLSNPGLVVMLFSHRINSMGVLGFVTSCDFFSRNSTTRASSDEAGIFYAVAPTVAGSDFSADTPARWMWRMRSTVIHEVKHIASMAERISRGAATLEHSWMEEGTARHAEELWARSIYGSQWKGNTRYQESMHCEVRPSTPGCAGMPYVMYKHFGALYRYLERMEELSPIGRMGESDATFYGSAWSFIRWAIDHHASSDEAFLTALTQETQLAGVANLEARTGRSFRAMLADWSLALAVDDHPGGVASRAELTLPSWHSRDVSAGMSSDFPATYTSAWPVARRQLASGSFSVDVSSLAGGSASLFEISGSTGAPQLLELRATDGGPPPAAIGMAIVRVE